MTENFENNNTGSNRFLSVGIVVALILIGVSCLYIAKILEKKLEQQNREQSESNPLISEPKESIDEGKPDIPGVVVYDAETDVDDINIDTEKRELQYRKNIENMKKNPNSEKQLVLLKMKEEFAAKRLTFLRKIEEAETKEERLKLIEELKEFCEGNSTENKTEEPRDKKK